MSEDERYAEKVKGYDLDSLLDIKDHINREKYPERYKLVIEEIAKREREPNKAQQLAEEANHEHTSAEPKAESFDGKAFQSSDQAPKSNHQQYRRSLRILLVIYLGLCLIEGAYGLKYSFESKDKIDVSVSQVDYQSIIEKDERSAIFLLMSPIVCFFSMAIVGLEMLAWIALFMFWRFGPTLFLISVLLVYILFPLIGDWFNQQTVSWAALLGPEVNPDVSPFLRPLNSIHLLLIGSILTIINLKEGRRLFDRSVGLIRRKHRT